MTLAVQSRTERPGGKQLQRLVARKQAADPFTGWEAWRAKASAIAVRGAKRVGPFVAMEMAIAYADLKAKDLEARVAALESREVPATARAPDPKPPRSLSLRLMRDIDDAVCDKLIGQIEAAKDRDIRLTVASPGGLVGPAQRLASAIVKHGRVDTHSIVNASSAALLVFSAGRKRSALKGCRYLLHAPSLGGKPARNEAERRELDACARDIAKFLAKRTGEKASRFLGLMTEEGHTIDAGEASMLNLVNTVVHRTHTPKARNK